MDIREIAIRIESAKFLKVLMAVLQEIRVPLDPCAGDPRFEQDKDGQVQLHILAVPRVERELKERQYKFDVIKDFSDDTDPREYTSQVNRFESRLRELK